MKNNYHPRSGKKGSLVGKVFSVTRHHNGCCGNKFFRVEFLGRNHYNEPAKTRLVAVVTIDEDDEDRQNDTLKQVFVMSPTDPDLTRHGGLYARDLEWVVKEFIKNDRSLESLFTY